MHTSCIVLQEVPDDVVDVVVQRSRHSEHPLVVVGVVVVVVVVVVEQIAVSRGGVVQENSGVDALPYT